MDNPVRNFWMPGPSREAMFIFWVPLIIQIMRYIMDNHYDNCEQQSFGSFSTSTLPAKIHKQVSLGT